MAVLGREWLGKALGGSGEGYTLNDAELDRILAIGREERRTHRRRFLRSIASPR